MTDSGVVVPPPERIQADLEHLKEWISKEPHLPSIDDEEWLKTFLYNNKFSLEKTKFKLDNYYAMRTKYPEYFTKRDPRLPELVKQRGLYKALMAHKPMKDGSLVVHTRIEGDPSDLDMTAHVKWLFMEWDVRCLDPANRLANYIVIADYSKIKTMHLIKSATVTSVVSEVLDKAYSFRIKCVHCVNFPSFAQTFFDTAMKFFPKKLQERFQFHSSADALLKLIDEDVLSSEYGGKGPSLAELEEILEKRLEKARDWFLEQDNVCSNEELRPKDANKPEEMKGSFRKMNVD